MNEDRLKRLVRSLEALAEKDAQRLREEQRIWNLRRQSAFELYVICSNFVRTLNAQLTRIQLELSPSEFAADRFRDAGPNIFQINASGRIIQIAFEAAEPLVSTEDFLTPYTLEGAVRWFSQESLEGMGIGEHLLFLCLRNTAAEWVYFDPQTHRRGAFDEDYLALLLEQLVK